MSLRQFLSVLRARHRLALGVLLAVVALAVAWLAWRSPVYVARAPVLVDVRTDPVGSTPLQGMVSPSYVSTQIDIVKSRRVAERVVELLPPDQEPMKRLRERIRSLGEMIRHRQGVAERDLERLEDASVDYLGLWLADLSMVERQSAVDEAEVERRIAEIGKRIESGAADARSLQKARSDLEELLIRHRRLASRKAAVEAALLSLPDAVEEIYHAVVTMPASGEGGARLQEAIERLRLEEELESSYGAEIREILPQKAARTLHVVKQ